MRQAAIFISMLLAATHLAGENQELLVSTSWLQQHLHDRNLRVIEVGERGSYESGHIPGAGFIALSELVISTEATANELPSAAAVEKAFRGAGVRDRARIVLYSREPIPATRAFFTLDYAGHGARTAILDGGFAKWTAEQRAVESGAPRAVKEGDFRVRPHPEAVIRLNALKKLVDCADWLGSKFTLIDSRSPGQFDSGHIVCATNIPWQENLVGEEFKPLDELKALYSRTGTAPGGTVVTYCNTGMQASVTYFVLRYLGRDVHLYDGSYSEWSKTN